MKKTTLLFFITVISLTVTAQKLRIEDFRDIEWGTHIDSIFIDGEQVTLKKKKDEVDNSYYLYGDKMSIGSVGLSKIIYQFNGDDRFYKVMMDGNRDQIKEMIFILNYKFGDRYTTSEVDNVIYRQWVVQDVTFTLSEFAARDFNLTIESDWEQRTIIDKNSNVKDF